MDHERTYAVNVKCYLVPDQALVQVAGLDFASEIWNEHGLCFWQEAEQVAKKYGYDEVTAEGRSGGWLVPWISNSTVGEHIRDQDDGHEVDLAEQNFQRFALEIKRLQREYEDDFIENLREQAAKNKTSA